MKIERLSENQIRCTLYKADLADKELLLTELAYGTDKAKELFRELMQQASNELGFEVDNIPLMIEAIPVSPECLVLIITKVEDPDELDTRFSRFTRPLSRDDDDMMEIEDDDMYDIEDDMSEGPGGPMDGPMSEGPGGPMDGPMSEGPGGPMDGPMSEGPGGPKSNHGPMHPGAPDGLIEALGNLAQGLSALGNRAAMKKGPGASPKAEESREIFRIYAFKSLDQVILSAKLVTGIYKSENTLYKNPQDSSFYLYMTKDKNTEGEFVRTCNLISEYGSKVRTTYATPSHMEEHFKLIINGNALQTLSEL